MPDLRGAEKERSSAGRCPLQGCGRSGEIDSHLWLLVEDWRLWAKDEALEAPVLCFDGRQLLVLLQVPQGPVGPWPDRTYPL